MGEVIDFTGYTTLDLPPDQVLEQAKASFKRVVVIGVTAEDEVAVAASDGDIAAVNWLLDLAKLELMRQVT